MYTRPYFELDEKKCLSLIQEQPFGQVIAGDSGYITQAFLPLVYDEAEHCLFAHIAKQNELAMLLTKTPKVLVTFLAENAYLSPSWYLSTGQVPTWNYRAVEVEGNAQLLDRQATLKAIMRQSDFHESQFETPWKIDKVPSKNIEAMLNAIIGIKIDIAKITGQAKMSQNKSLDDRKSLIEGLQQHPSVNSHQVAETMLKEVNR
jgi:transcriptional regulator